MKTVSVYVLYKNSCLKFYNFINIQLVGQYLQLKTIILRLIQYLIHSSHPPPPLPWPHVLVIPTETVTIDHIVRYNNHHLPPSFFD
jgi:hypothetical protein